MICSSTLDSSCFLLALIAVLCCAAQASDIPPCALDGYDILNLTKPKFWEITLISNSTCLPNATAPCKIAFAFCKPLVVPFHTNASSDACINVAGCQQSANNQTFSMGQYEDNPFSAGANPDSFEATFANGSQSSTCAVSTSFTFLCNKSQPWLVPASDLTGKMPEPITVTYTASNCSYRFVVGYAGACRDPEQQDYLSPGSVLLIIFAIVVILYCAGGMALNYYLTPNSDHWFPHYGFWSEFPGYVVDGWIFFCSIVTCRYSALYRTYETI